MKYINRIGMMVVAGLALATTSCSDFDDYNSVPNDVNVTATKTLYENISENGKLNDFAAIINKAGYQSVLNSSQCYTLWAPLDGTYDASSILAMDSAKIVDRFINMHLAQFSHPVSGVVDERIISLNDKHHTFTNTGFDELQIAEANIPATNGLMHTINGLSAYYPNIYEYLDAVEGCDSFANYIHFYDIPYIDKRKSVEGPMLNGQQTYLDTVWTKRNTAIRQILRADIEDEDSSFTVLFPTDAAWDSAVSKISPLYQYISPVNFMDVTSTTTPAASLKEATGKSDTPAKIDVELYNDSLPKYHIMRNLAYSNSYQCNAPLVTNQATENDTLYSTSRNSFGNVAEVLSHCGELQPMSNGYVRTLDDICFKPWDTYNPVRGYLSPERTLGLKAGMFITSNTLGKDSLVNNPKYFDMFSEVPDFLKLRLLPKESNFFYYASTDSAKMALASSKPELDYALTYVLSTKYHIYVVFVPKQLEEPWRPVTVGSTQNKDLYLQFNMSYTDENGAQQYKRINVPGAKKLTDDIVVVNDGKFHVVELEFTFPICYYGLNAYPTLFISNTKSFTNSTNRRKFEQELRIAGVYLVPEEAYEHVQSLKY